MKKVLQYKQLIIIILILLVAAFLRLYKIGDYLTFLGDEGRDALVVYNILHGKLTLLGPTSSVGGFFMGPIYYYFMTPFFWVFNYSPVGPAVMVALFGIATVWLIYKIGSEFFTQKAGIVAALLYAISPVVIGYSRSSWNPNLMPFFSLLILYILYKGVTKKKRLLFFVSGILFGIAMQLHYISTFLGVIIALYIAITIFREKQTIVKNLFLVTKRYLLFFAGFLVGFSPFLAFEVRHAFSNTRSIFNFILHSGETDGGQQIVPIFWESFVRIFGRLVMKFPQLEDISLKDSLFSVDIFSTTFQMPFYYWYAFCLLIGFFSVGLLLYQFYQTIKKDKKDFPKILLLVLWFFVGIGMFGFYKKSIYDYYFAFMFPLPFLLIGNAFAFLWEKTRAIKIMLLVCLFVVVFVNLQGIPFRFPANRQLHQAETIAKFVYEKADGKPYNFALITGGNSDHAYRYFFTVWNHPPQTIENVQNDPERKSVTKQLFVVCESLPCGPLGHSLWEIAGFGRAEIAGVWDVSVVKVYKLVPYAGN